MPHSETTWQFLGAHFAGDDEDILMVCLKDAVLRWPHISALETLEPGMEATWCFNHVG